jgi:phosphoglycerate dehydrogenase-like enzyme
VSTASIMLRRLGWADAELKAGNYAAFRTRLVGGNLAGIDGLLVGIVGLGIIGLAVAQAFVKAGCRVCYYDPAPSDPKAAAALGAEALPLAELLRRADIVTLHVPLLPATQGLIGSAELASMKKDAILIQASRGGIVDEKALADSLRAGHLGGAVVDVFSTEPPAPNNPLFTLEGDAARRLLLTPHIAGVTRQSAAFLFRTAWQNVERVVIAGQAPLHRAY